PSASSRRERTRQASKPPTESSRMGSVPHGAAPDVGPVASQDPRTRREPGRAPPASRRAVDADVLQLAAVTHAAQEQPASAHVASSDEIAREAEPLAEGL